MEFFMLPLLAIWTFIAVIIGRYAGRRTGRRWVKWTVLLCIWFLPWTDVLIGSVLAQWRLFRLGHVWVDERVEANGFLSGHNLNSTTPSLLEYLRPEVGYQYVEVKYSEAVSATPSFKYGPGYYQFRISALDRVTCLAMDESAMPPHIYRPHGQSHCFEFTRSEEPVSRYSFTSRQEKQTPLQRWFKVKIRCTRVIDLKRNRDIARECVATVGSWMRDGTPPTLTFGKARLEALDVIKPQITNKQ